MRNEQQEKKAVTIDVECFFCQLKFFAISQ